MLITNILIGTICGCIYGMADTLLESKLRKNKEEDSITFIDTDIEDLSVINEEDINCYNNEIEDDKVEIEEV